jgi:hypothetical protein
MGQQPTWTLGKVPPHQQDGEPQDPSNEEAEPPAHIESEETRIQQQECGRSSDRCAQPVGAVDEKVDRSRTRAGISSSMAELMAEYSPPIPMPVKKRKAKNIHASRDSAVSMVATR